MWKKYYSFTRTDKNEEISKDFIRLESPEHLIALKCTDEEMEKRITDRLREHNIDYKRSSTDIEIMSVNAKAKWMKKRGGINDDKNS